MAACFIDKLPNRGTEELIYVLSTEWTVDQFVPLVSLSISAYLADEGAKRGVAAEVDDVDPWIATAPPLVKASTYCLSYTFYYIQYILYYKFTCNPVVKN